MIPMIKRAVLLSSIIALSAADLCAQTAEARQPINVYSYLAPLTVLLIFSELIYLAVSRKNLLSFQEAIANLGTAIGNQTMNLLIAASVYQVYGYLWTHFRLA